jgi:hypothetical protein
MAAQKSAPKDRPKVRRSLRIAKKLPAEASERVAKKVSPKGSTALAKTSSNRVQKCSQSKKRRRGWRFNIDEHGVKPLYADGRIVKQAPQGHYLKL